MAQIADIIKYEGDNSTFVWKHPCEDFSSLTQLIVHESQEALFLMNGQALDLFGPGRYTLESQNIPKLGKQFEKTFGGDTPFHCEVYFINKTVQMGLKWGAGDINFIEPSMSFPIKLGASGEMNLMVSDSRKLLTKLIGTMSGVAWDDRDADGNRKVNKNGLPFAQSLRNTFRPLIATAVKSHLATSIKENNIDLLEIDENLEHLSETLRKKILPGFEEYGLYIPQLYITTVLLPENDHNFQTWRDVHTFAFQKKVAEAQADLEVARETAKIDATTAIHTAQAEAEATRATARIEAETSVRLAKTEADAAVKIAQTEAEAREKQAEISKVEAESAVKIAQTEAAVREKQVEVSNVQADQAIRMAQTESDAAVRLAEIEARVRQTEADTARIEAEAQHKKIGAMADIELERAKGLAEAEVARAKGMANVDIAHAQGMAEAEIMQHKGYTQRDVLQADVQTEYAKSLGQIGANGGNGGGMGINASGFVGDMVNFGMGMAAAQTVVKPMGEMFSGLTNAAMGATSASANAVCPKCGSAVPANSKFCLECGTKIEALAADEVICPVCGKKVRKGKFCLECGASLINKCPVCGAEVAPGGKFCPECGTKL